MDSRGRKKRPNKSGAGGGPRGFYVYCIGEAGPLRQPAGGPPPEAIEPGAPLEAIEAGELSAIVSAVPLSDYGEEPLPARLSDPAWTAERAMRHEKVLEHYAARAAIIPLRFGTIYVSRDRVRGMISERQPELRSIIERLRGKEEWAVNVCCDRAALMEAIVSLSPKLRELDERAKSASAGQAYLLGKQIEAMRADEARAETARVVSRILEELSALSAGAASLRVLRGEAASQGEVVAKLAFLVSRSRFDEFYRAAERLAGEHAAAGFRLELTGPWPAYNFATDGGQT